MNPTLQAADALAKAVREASNEDDGCLYVHGHYDGKIQLALRDYERAKEGAKPVAADWMRGAAKDIVRLTIDCEPLQESEIEELVETGVKVIAELCPNAPAPQPEEKEDLRAFVHEVHFNHRYFPGPGSTWFIDFGQDCIRDYLSKHAPAQASRDGAITAQELLKWVESFIVHPKTGVDWTYKTHAEIIEHYIGVLTKVRAAKAAEAKEKP